MPSLCGAIDTNAWSTLIGRTATGEKPRTAAGAGLRLGHNTAWHTFVKSGLAFESPRRSMCTKGGWDDVLPVLRSVCLPGQKEDTLRCRAPPSPPAHHPKECEGGMDDTRDKTLNRARAQSAIRLRQARIIWRCDASRRTAPNWFYFSFLNFNLTKGRTSSLSPPPWCRS